MPSTGDCCDEWDAGTAVVAVVRWPVERASGTMRLPKKNSTESAGLHCRPSDSGETRWWKTTNPRVIWYATATFVSCNTNPPLFSDRQVRNERIVNNWLKPSIKVARRTTLCEQSNVKFQTEIYFGGWNTYDSSEQSKKEGESHFNEMGGRGKIGENPP